MANYSHPITANPDYGPLPPDTVIIRQRSIDEGDTILTIMDYQAPGTGVFTRQLRRRKIVSKRRPAVKRNLSIGVDLTGDAGPQDRDQANPDRSERDFAGNKVDVGLERRGLDRGGRDRRTTPDQTAVTGQSGSDRRTGGPLESFVSEVKSFVTTPTGAITAGVGVITVVFGFIRLFIRK